MDSTRTLVVLLAGGLAVASGSTTSRGGIVTVVGTGFAPGEAVTLALSGIATTVTAKADAKGMLPAIGISIPYSVAAGASVTITATGATSKRSATAMVAVAKLALNGEAISTTAPITTSNGAFSATFTAPPSLLRGVNTLGAIGNESRVSAVTSLAGNLTSSTQFYMAGGLNTAAASSNIAILNTNNQPASVDLTFYFANGVQVPKTVSVPAHATRLFVGTVLGLPQGTFGVKVASDRQVAAELTVNRYNHTDGDSIPGSTGLSTRWYLAAGSTDGGTETLSVLNPDPTRAAHVQMQLLGVQGRARVMRTMTVLAHTNATVTLNSSVPAQGVSVVALSDAPQRRDAGQRRGAGALQSLGGTGDGQREFLRQHRARREAVLHPRADGAHHDRGEHAGADVAARHGAAGGPRQPGLHRRAGHDHDQRRLLPLHAGHHALSRSPEVWHGMLSVNRA